MRAHVPATYTSWVVTVLPVTPLRHAAAFTVTTPLSASVSDVTRDTTVCALGGMDVQLGFDPSTVTTSRTSVPVVAVDTISSRLGTPQEGNTSGEAAGAEASEQTSATLQESRENEGTGNATTPTLANCVSGHGARGCLVHARWAHCARMARARGVIALCPLPGAAVATQ